MRKTTLLAIILSAMVSACSSIDCPLNNRVYTRYKLDGLVTKLSDTLTISTMRTIDGSDTVLINLQVNTDSFELPMSYNADKDVFYFETKDTLGGRYMDTVAVSKTNEPHFEAVDCNANYFHTITAIDYTTNGIDSIKINNNKVSYDSQKPHFIIYFKPHY